MPTRSAPASRKLRLEQLEGRQLMAGDLAPTFGDYGVLERPLLGAGDPPDLVHESVLDAQGRAILLSQTPLFREDRHAIQVTRLTSTGALDPTFGGDGTAVIRLPSGLEEARDIAVQGSKILVLATSHRSNADKTLEYSVLRLNGQGNLDKSFGIEGRLATPSTPIEAFDPARLIVSRTGHIYVLSGHIAKSVAIHRFTADGKFDPTFGVNGLVEIEGSWNSACDLVELKDNSLVVAFTYDNGNTNYMMRMAHVSRDGVVDNQFGASGRHEITITNNQMFSNYGRVRLGLDAQDNIYVAGMRRTDQAQDFFVQKLSSQGALDSTYGVGGEATIVTGEGWGTLLQDLIISPTGEATLSGTTSYVTRPFVMRISASGVPDNSGGGVGMNIISATRTDTDGMGGLLRLGNGQLLAAFTNYLSRQIDLFSFDIHGTANTAFGNGGELSINPVRSRFVAEGLAITELSSHKLLSLTRDLAPKPPEQLSFADLILTRYMPDGTVDNTYGDKGQLRLNVDASSDTMHDPIFSHNGVKYLAYTEKNSKLRISRLTDDGYIDSGFGTSGWIEWEYPRGTIRVYQTDSIAAVDDGFIVTSGGSGGIASSGYLITKLDLAGRVVSDFGVGGSIHITKLGAAGTFTKVVARADGSFAVLMSHPSDIPTRFVTVIRQYTADGQPDGNFGANGAVMSDLSPWTLTTDRQILLRDDGGIVTFGGVTPADQLMVEQYTPTGALDPTFGSGGRLRIQTGADASESRALLIDSQDRLVLVAKNRIKGEENALVYRLTPNGALDMSFGKDGVRRLFLSQYDDHLDTVTELANGDLILAGTCITDSTIEPVFVKLGEHVSDWYNGGMRHDVNEDEAVSAIDALLIINRLNSISTASLPQQKPDGAPLVDVNGDNNCTPLDALLVINLLNLNSAGNGEGESEGEGESHLAPTLAQATAVDWSLDSVVEQWRRRLSR